MDPTRTIFTSVNRVVRPLVKAGLGSPLPIGLGAVVVETTGRTTHQPRQVPLLGLRLGRRVIVSTLRPHSHWLRNLEANHHANVWYAGRPHPADATIQRGPLNIVTLDPTPTDNPD